jgi:dTDP-4-amino-4,6-dideoxygalactose transaminase
MQPVFKLAEYFGSNVAEDLFHNGLCLPSGSNLTEEDLHRIVTIIREVFEGASSSSGATMSKIA